MMILQKLWACREKRCITGFRLEIFRNRRSKRCPNCSVVLSTIFSFESQRVEVDDTNNHSTILDRECERGIITQIEHKEISSKVIDRLLRQMDLLFEKSNDFYDGSNLVQMSEEIMRIAKLII